MSGNEIQCVVEELKGVLKKHKCVIDRYGKAGEANYVLKLQFAEGEIALEDALIEFIVAHD